MPRLPKGSAEAKERMAHLRSLRKKKLGGSIDPSAVVPEEKEGEGMTPWVKHVAEFAKKHSLNYFEALKDPKVKEGYKKK